MLIFLAVFQHFGIALPSPETIQQTGTEPWKIDFELADAAVQVESKKLWVDMLS